MKLLVGAIASRMVWTCLRTVWRARELELWMTHRATWQYASPQEVQNMLTVTAWTWRASQFCTALVGGLIRVQGLEDITKTEMHAEHLTAEGLSAARKHRDQERMRKIWEISGKYIELTAKDSGAAEAFLSILLRDDTEDLLDCMDPSKAWRCPLWSRCIERSCDLLDRQGKSGQRLAIT